MSRTHDITISGFDLDHLENKLAAVTKERDEWKAKYIQQNKDLGCEMMDPNGTIWDYAKKLQTELPAVTKQLNEARDTIAMLTNTLRNNNDAGKAEYEELKAELAAVTEQRDRLAEELKKIKKHLKDANRGAKINAHALKINTDKLIAATEQLNEVKEYADRLVEHKDMACLPADLENLRKANAAFADENHNLKERSEKLEQQLAEHKLALQSGDAHCNEMFINLERTREERDELIVLTHLLGRALKSTRWDSPVLCDEAMKSYENYCKELKR